MAALRFVLGRTGTGKTRLVLDEVAAQLAAAPWGPPLLVLVPEQATFQTEQALLARPGIAGYARAQVLSFRRLAWRVLRETGDTALPVLSDRGKRMVLRALLARHQGELGAFAQVSGRTGFADALARSLSELRAYGWTPADLRRATAPGAPAAAEPLLAAKLADLALVTESLERYCAGRFLDPDDHLRLLAERIAGSRVVHGAEVWVDGFAGFTPAEQEVLAAVWHAATRVTVTLLLDSALDTDPAHLADPTYLFHPSLETHQALYARARAEGVTVERPVLLDRPGAPPRRFARAPELAYLEARFHPTRRTPPYAGPAPRLVIGGFARRRDEVRAAARELLRLAREEGLRFREMAVLLRDLDAYADLVVETLAAHGVPAFLDRRRPVPHHPLVEDVRAAVDVVASDWDYEPVFRFLKNDLVVPAADRDDVDLLEQYVLLHGLRGWRCWSGPPWRWTSRGDFDALGEEVGAPAGASEEASTGTASRRSAAQAAQLARIADGRRRWTGALADFTRRMHAAAAPDGVPVAAVADALAQLLAALDARAQLEQASAAALEAGDPDQARAEAQVWTQVLGLLDDLVLALAETTLPADDLGDVLEAGLATIELGLIPPGLDQVVVGSIERSRHLGIRAAFVLGANEGALPPAPAEEPLLTDADRERLEDRGASAGRRLAPTGRERLLHEHYFSYLTLTRASERLWVSWPTADSEGRELREAALVRRLRAAFPGAATPPVADGLAEVATPRDLVDALGRTLRHARTERRTPGALPLHLHALVARDGALASLARPVLAALDEEGASAARSRPLGPDLARALYGAGDVLRTSVSRLESFAACPHRHFVRYGLALEERPRPRLEAPEWGKLAHAALERFVRRLWREGLRWDALDAEREQALGHAVFDELAPFVANDVLLSDPLQRQVLARARRALGATLEALGEHERRGDFRTVAVELPFGLDAPGALPALELTVAGGRRALLRGKIDRVDAWQGPGGRVYLRVLDYKSSDRPFSLARLAHGLELQLAAYLASAVGNAGAVVGRADVAAEPAGLLYFGARDPIVPVRDASDAAAVAAARRRAFRTRGLVRDDARIARAMDREAVGHSPLVPVQLASDGTVAATSSTATRAGFEAVFAHVGAVAAEGAARVLDGDVAVRPIRLGENERACTTCSYRAVCQFDPTVAGQGYDVRERLGRDEAWARIRGTADDAEAE